MASKPTTEQLQRAVSVICKVIAQIPCFHFYEEYVARRFESSEAELSLKAMTHNAALDSALLNIRCFNEFFKPDGRPDDVRAYHFPGLSLQPFLCRDDENAIHKHLAHLTVTRSDISAKPWMLDHMTILGLQHGIQFLDFIDARFPMNTGAAQAELRGVREVGSLLIRKLGKQHGNQDG